VTYRLSSSSWASWCERYRHTACIFCAKQALSSQGTTIKIVVLQSRKEKKNEAKEMTLKKGGVEVRERRTSPQFPSYCVTNSHGLPIGRQGERSTGHVARSIRLSAIVDFIRLRNLGQTDVRLLVLNVQPKFGY
jgi:hypothetical protein